MFPGAQPIKAFHYSNTSHFNKVSKTTEIIFWNQSHLKTPLFHNPIHKRPKRVYDLLQRNASDCRIGEYLGSYGKQGAFTITYKFFIIKLDYHVILLKYKAWSQHTFTCQRPDAHDKRSSRFNKS
jgi:hypothetical protein